MLIEQQIAERQARATSAVTRVLERPASGEYGDYKIKSSSGRSYRVALRGPGLFDNYCSCPDFAVNTLGTCKHIEALLARVKGRRRKTAETAEYKRSRASISLKYGDTIEVWLHLPASPSPALLALAAQYFDSAGLLLREHYRQFSEVLAAIQKIDDQAVVYSDVLDYLDRENELAEGLVLERKLLAKLKQDKDPVPGRLNTKLLPYQTRGALFAAPGPGGSGRRHGSGENGTSAGRY